MRTHLRLHRPTKSATTVFFLHVAATLGLVTAWTAPRLVAGEAAPSWLDSSAGVSDAVLPPWTPVDVSNGEVSVWGRKYVFRGLPFPRSVVTLDTQILASAITLSGRADGKGLAWHDAACHTLEAKPNAVRLATRAESESLSCEGVVTVEYDGMVRVAWKLVPKGKKVSIEQLSLEIPLRPEFARYLHHWPGRWGSAFNSTSLPDDGYHGAFKPFYWLGDEWRGLAWFSESDRNFFSRQNDRVIDIVRDGDSVVFRVNLIAGAQTIETPLEYTFGFQATPVKPQRPDVWDYRICHMGAYGLEDREYVPPTSPSSAESTKSMKTLDRLAEAGVRTICFHEHWTDIQAYPKTTHGERLKKLVKACHDRDIQLLLYLGYEMSTIAPEWDAYHEKCLVHPRRGGYKRKYQPEPDQTAYIVCYRSVWQDFIAHHLQELMDEYRIDGVYLDGTSEPWGCRNEHHGCGYKRPDGTMGQTFPIFDTRSMMKRIYTIVKSHNHRGQVNVHQSTCMTIPTLAFATSYWDGEHLQNVARPKSADEVLPLDAFRCEFMGHNWGVPAELLHYTSGPFKRSEAVGLALLHDVLVRPSTMADIDVSSKLWHAMDEFGRNQATWLPYWEDHQGVRSNPSGVKVSLHNRPGQGMIAVIANLGSQKCMTDLTFDVAALGQPSDLAVSDILTEDEIPFASGKLAIPLDPLQFAVLRFTPENGRTNAE